MDKIKEGDSCRCNELEGRILKLEIAKNSTDDYKARMGKKLDNLEEWAREVGRQQTQQSVNLAVLKTEIEQQQKDREEKHKAITTSIDEIKNNLKSFIDTILDKIENKADKSELKGLEKNLEVVSFFSKHPKLMIPLVAGLYILTFDEIRKPILKILGVE